MATNVSDWMEIYNRTADYGDQTCQENSNGNPWKQTFVEILQHWKSISWRHNISYFLTFGSLIGAVRNADFITWDHDMDIMIDKSYYDIIASIDNERNFVLSGTDPNFHLVVQNYFKQSYNDYTFWNGSTMRTNCIGQVSKKACWITR